MQRDGVEVIKYRDKALALYSGGPGSNSGTAYGPRLSDPWTLSSVGLKTKIKENAIHAKDK